MHRKWSVGGVFGAALFACLFMGSPQSLAADQESASVSLVGRNGKFQEVKKDGSVNEVDSSHLKLSGSGGKDAGQSSQPEVKTATKNAKEGKAKNTKGEAGGPGTAVAAPAQNKPKELSPAEKAARANDAEALRRLLDQGGGYFYDADKKPLSYEEVKKRIDEGNVTGISAVDLHLQPWGSHDVGAKEGTTYPMPEYTRLKPKDTTSGAGTSP